MFLKSLNGKDIQVALLSGHCTIVGPEGCEVAPMFVAEAMRMGCVTADVMADDIPKELPVVPDAGRVGRVAEAVRAMLEDGCELTGTGMPHLKEVQKNVGFMATKEELVAAWGVLEAEAAS